MLCSIFVADDITLDKANDIINQLHTQINSLKMKLDSTTKDEFSVSKDLCNLRMKLLEDGKVKYLEKLSTSTRLA